MCTLTSKTVNHTIQFIEIPCQHNNDTDVILVHYGLHEYGLLSACPSRVSTAWHVGVVSRAKALKIARQQGLRIVAESDKR